MHADRMLETERENRTICPKESVTRGVQGLKIVQDERHSAFSAGLAKMGAKKSPPPIRETGMRVGQRLAPFAPDAPFRMAEW